MKSDSPPPQLIAGEQLSRLIVTLVPGQTHTGTTHRPTPSQRRQPRVSPTHISHTPNRTNYESISDPDIPPPLPINRLKHFAHPDFNLFKKIELEPIFDRVHYVKPESSRSESSEGFFVCLGYRPRR